MLVAQFLRNPSADILGTAISDDDQSAIQILSITAYFTDFRSLRTILVGQPNPLEAISVYGEIQLTTIFQVVANSGQPIPVTFFLGVFPISLSLTQEVNR